MSFLCHIRDQCTKLRSYNYVNYIWDELRGLSRDYGEISSNALTDYNNHLPVLMDEFWESTLEKLKDSLDDLDEFDDDLKKYTLVLLYQCTTHTSTHEVVSFASLLRASQVYLILLTTRHQDDFLKSKLYKSVISNMQNALESASSTDDLNGCIHSLGAFVKCAKMKISDMEMTLAFFAQVICIKSKRIYPELSDDPTDDDACIVYQSMYYMKQMLQSENLPSRKFLVTTYLFNGLRKLNTPNLFIVQSNFRSIMENLQEKFREDKYETFLNAFLHIVQHHDLFHFTEATIILNILPRKHYQTFMEVLNKLLLASNPTRNIFRLSMAIICNPGKHMPVERAVAANEILLRNILTNSISKKSDVSNFSIESLAEILTSPDLDQVHVRAAVQVLFNYAPGESTFNVPTILRALKSTMDKKWRNRARNKNLFAISMSIMYWCDKDYPVAYHEILELLSEEASPYDLKPYLSLMSETFVKFSEKRFSISALNVLKVMVKMALHPMATSSDFVKHLYTAMVHQTLCKGKLVNREFYIDPIISNAFNFKELFRKCHTLGLIRSDHVIKAMNDIQSQEEHHLKLLCATISLTDYKNLQPISKYIDEHFMIVCNSPKLKYLLFVYNELMKSSNSNHDRLSNETMLRFLHQHLMQQTLRWDAVPNAFALLKNFKDTTDLDDLFLSIKEDYDRRLERIFETGGSFLPIYYYAQLVLFSKLLPNERNGEAMKTFTDNCSKEIYNGSVDYSPKLYIGCLMLYTNMCLIDNDLIDVGLNMLNRALNCRSIPVKRAALDFTFDLCNLVSHSFEDLISYMFIQLIQQDVAFKKTCLIKIDRLIRDDYLKLDERQFTILVSILGDRNHHISTFLKNLLSESFFVLHTAVINKYFLYLLVYVNLYKKHPIFRIGVNEAIIMEKIAFNVLYKRKMYDILLGTLPLKSKLSIATNVSTHILENVMKKELKLDDGFWKMIKDAVYVFKAISSIPSNEGEVFYKRVISKISQHIVHKSDYSEERIHQEHHVEVMKCTQVLLKLLFYNDSDNLQRHIGGVVFDALMHWTEFLFPDIVHLVHSERCKDIAGHYGKVEGFYKKNSQMIQFHDEIIDGGNIDYDIDSNSLFTIPSTSRA